MRLARPAPAWALLISGGTPALIALVAGCAHTAYEAHPISAAQTAASFDARSLDDPDLRRFLGENLGGSFPDSAAVTRNFDTLAWVAFYYNPTLDVARAQWESARAAVRTAGARPNPTLAHTPGYSTNSGDVSPWFPAVTFDLPIETARKRQHRATGAERSAEAARQAVFTAAWRIRSDLRRALLDLAAALPRLECLRAQAALQQHAVALLEQRLRAGAIAASEVATARLAALRSEALVADAARQLPLARQRVAVALGISAAALAEVALPAPATPPPLPPDQLAAARRLSLQTRPDVLAALARYDAAESALALEVARQFPDVHLGPGYQWDQGQNKWTIGVSFELPLFNSNEGPIAEATARRREAAAQFLATQAQALAEIGAAATAQSTAADQLAFLRRIQSQLDEQRARTAARRRAGAADQLEANGADLEAETGRLALSDAEAGAALAAGALEDALQIPFTHLSILEQSPSAAASSLP